MKSEIIYHHNSGGRSGHVLKDIFTSVILGELFGLTATYGKAWEKQKLLPVENVQRLLPRPTIALKSHQLCLPNKKCQWDGISFREVETLRQQVANVPGRVRFELSGVTRIHLSQVHCWETQGLVAEGVYDHLLLRLKQMYWGPSVPCFDLPGQISKVVIHVRRGDVARQGHPMYRSMGPGLWSKTFYQKEIAKIRKRFPRCRIRVLTERSNSGDLDGLRGVVLDRGGTESIDQHFRQMIEADLFMPANSGLSTWAAHLSRGRIWMTANKIKHYEFAHPPKKWLQSSELPQIESTARQKRHSS